jgi:hypothetical protein
MDYITKSMMEVTMEEEDIDMYSSPYENYLRLLQTIQALESGARLTEDWFSEHIGHILKYRDVFPNIGKINEEIEDIEFRTKASEAEVLLSNLVDEIKKRKTFTTKIYLLLNKRMKDLTEIIFGEDELLEMLGKMGV